MIVIDAVLTAIESFNSNHFSRLWNVSSVVFQKFIFLNIKLGANVS